VFGVVREPVDPESLLDWVDDVEWLVLAVVPRWLAATTAPVPTAAAAATSAVAVERSFRPESRSLLRARRASSRGLMAPL
jgi:hypothetical protein